MTRKIVLPPVDQPGHGPKAVRLPRAVIGEVIHRARCEGRSYSETLTALVQYGLTQMPGGWTSPPTGR